jgi:hypothetical protein
MAGHRRLSALPNRQRTTEVPEVAEGNAKLDGEDVLTSLMQQAAINILTEVTKT